MEDLELKVVKTEDVKKEENVTKIAENADKKITNDKIEDSLNYDSLTKEEQEAIDDFNKKIDVDDSTQVIQYGAKAQSKISQFSDSVLDGVRTRNAGEVGDLLANLVGEIKSFDKISTKS